MERSSGVCEVGTSGDGRLARGIHDYERLGLFSTFSAMAVGVRAQIGADDPRARQHGTPDQLQCT